MLQAEPAEARRAVMRPGAFQRRSAEFAGLIATRLIAVAAGVRHPAMETGMGSVLARHALTRRLLYERWYMGRMSHASTTPLTGPVAQTIAARLTAALSPTHLDVINESAQHRGHLGDDGSGESHFRVVVESAAFAGQSRVARQRLVNHALADLLAERIHALAIATRAPGE